MVKEVGCSLDTLKPVQDDPDAKFGAVNLLRAATSAVLVPTLITPLTRLETQITTANFSAPIFSVNSPFMSAISEVRKNPMKGYGLIASTSFMRSLLLFRTLPNALKFFNEHEYFKSHEYSQTTIKMMAYGVAGVTESVVMSPRIPLQQFKQTRPDYKLMQVFKDESLWMEFKRAWGVALRYGVMRDAIFWSLYGFNTAYIEKKLNVARQDESAVKFLEEFFIGASASFVASIVSFPVHGVMRRAIKFRDVQYADDKNRFMRKPFIVRDLSLAWNYFCNVNHAGTYILTSHVYKGFSTYALMQAVGMGMLKLSSHIADVGYESYSRNRHTFFGLLREPARLPAEKKGDEMLCRMGSL